MVGARSAARSRAARAFASWPALRAFAVSFAPGRYPPRLTPRFLAAPARNHAALFIGDHRHDADRQSIGCGHISGHEVDARLLEAKQEMRVAAEPIDLSDNELGAIKPAGLDSLGQDGTIGVLAAFDFDELLRQLPASAVEVISNRGALGFQTEAAAALMTGANPQVGNPFALSRHLSSMHKTKI